MTVGGLSEADALERLREASRVLVAGIVDVVPVWAGRHAARLGAAWGAWDPERLAAVCRDAEDAGRRAAERVAGELEALFAQDPAIQRATPLQIVRTAVREPGAVLAAAGLPGVVRDPFAEEAWPDDDYDLVPRTFRDLDVDLAAVHFAWGMAKADVLRARSAPPPE